MDIVNKIKKIIKKEYDNDVLSIYKYDDYYYVILDDFLASMVPIVDLELETSPGFIDRFSDLGNKILVKENLVF